MDAGPCPDSHPGYTLCAQDLRPKGPGKGHLVGQKGQWELFYSIAARELCKLGQLTSPF